MKKNFLTAALSLALSLNAIGAWADDNTGGNESATINPTYYVNAPRFVRPLVEKWIGEYQKSNPEAHFAIAQTAAGKKKSSVSVILQEKTEVTPGAKTVYFAQYAILPVTAKDSQAEKILAKKSLNTKSLKKLFFVGDDVEEADNKDKTLEQVVVYAGNSNGSLAAPFASYYGEQADNFRGKRISGDDFYLNSAIAEDPKGVTFNALPNVYDLQSRQLKDNLAVLPVDAGQEFKTSVSSLDNLIGVLENTHVKGIPVEKIGFSYTNNRTIDAFVSWILSQGTGYNHQFGLLKLSEKEVAQESTKVDQYTAQK